MNCSEDLFFDQKSLADYLGDIRNAGWYKADGKSRTKLVSELINTIRKEEANWTPDQCAFLFERLLRHYCPSNALEHMLAVSGYGDEFIRITSATQRRQHLQQITNDIDLQYLTPDALYRREKNYLSLIAANMEEDYKSGNLRRFVEDILAEKQGEAQLPASQDEMAGSSQESVELAAPPKESPHTDDALSSALLLIPEPTTPRTPPRQKGKRRFVTAAGLALLLFLVLFAVNNKKTAAPTASGEVDVLAEESDPEVPTTWDVATSEETLDAEATESSSVESQPHIAYADNEGIYWGDSTGGRTVYTKKELNSGAIGNRIVFNSVTDSDFGDERNFVGAALAGNSDSVWYGDEIKVKDGEIYVICLYVHNDNPNGLSAIAEHVRAQFVMTDTVSSKQTIIGYIDVPGTEPERYWDGVTLYADEPIFLEYIKGSAWYSNGGMNGILLTDDIVNNGAPLGYDRFDGKIPGGYGYDGIITIEVKVRQSFINKISLKARLKGTGLWGDEVDANIGDEVEFQIEFVNLTPDAVNNVMLRALLPNNMEYISGSTVLFNAAYQNGTIIDSDNIATTGINIGSYGPWGNSYLRFSCKIADNNLINGKTQLVVWTSSTVNDQVYKNNVSVFVKKR